MSAVKRLILHISGLRVVINWEKSMVVPVQMAAYLGLNLDVVSGCACLSNE